MQLRFDLTQQTYVYAYVIWSHACHCHLILFYKATYIQLCFLLTFVKVLFIHWFYNESYSFVILSYPILATCFNHYVSISYCFHYFSDILTRIRYRLIQNVLGTKDDLLERTTFINAERKCQRTKKIKFYFLPERGRSPNKDANYKCGWYSCS